MVNSPNHTDNALTSTDTTTTRHHHCRSQPSPHQKYLRGVPTLTPGGPVRIFFRESEN